MASLERRVAIDAARAAGHLLKSELPGSRHIAYKGSPTNLVTEMDARAEELIVGRLTAAFPDDAVLGEERGATAGRSGRRWIIDPLDGTTNYAHGLPIFCASLGLRIDGVATVGAVFDPTRQELFTAERGVGAWLNGQPLGVSATGTLIDALLVTGFPYTVRSDLDRVLRVFGAFLARARAVRRLGSAAIDLCYVAAGRIDGFWEENLQPWDTMAGALIVQEAGGTVTGVDGSPWDASDRHILASNGALHDEMVGVYTAAR
jgi:myo-inositol-1(or 4)-monophosphatase